MKDNWTSHTEDLVKQWGERASVYRILHNKCASKYKRWSTLITIPCIALSTIAGSLQFMIAGEQNEGVSGGNESMSLLVGTMNLGIAVMTSLNQFLKLQEKAEAHRVSSMAFGTYYRMISCELAFDRDSRQPADEFTLTAKKQFDTMIENAPEIDSVILEAFKQEIKEKGGVNCSLPDICNGLSGIVVCRDYCVLDEERRKSFAKLPSINTEKLNEELSTSSAVKSVEL
jgi:hypothetical protein